MDRRTTQLPRTFVPATASIQPLAASVNRTPQAPVAYGYSVTKRGMDVGYNAEARPAQGAEEDSRRI
ncbi:MAG: hypothetical protein BZY81_04945 [SAR202 cluster bacterium Io17-Chloro-G4]|nr:MAG: hypothetical protein BZY81_04945 [SAR202 cluster bacterium Io17-Chloro-G4]